MLKRDFKIALASAQMKQVDWARLHNVSECSISLFLKGNFKSRRLSALMNNFIEKEFSKLRLQKGIKKVA